LLLPLSDGGTGFIECLHNKLGGTIEDLLAPDPFGHIRPVPVLKLSDGTIAVECAKVVGLTGLTRLDPFQASSRGLGCLLEQLSHAPKLLVGLGGSATVDGGVDWPELSLPRTTVFCDVKTDLADAVRIFASQKGATSSDLPILQERLMNLGLPTGMYTGSAGGLGAKLLSLGAELVNGALAMLELLGFDTVCRSCDTVVTGEGKLDRTTLEGKLSMVVAERARSMGKKVIGHFGCRGEGWEEAISHFDEVRFEVI
jgi:glycerate kinase